MCNKMSDVRLSNASPTVERVDARQPDNIRLPVRRNLFGRRDPEETRRDFAASLQEDVQAFMDEYNFDPVDGRPLTPRNYDWQEDSNAPEFYLRQPHGIQRPQRDDDVPGENTRQDGEGSSGRQSVRQPGRHGSRKRRSGASGDLNWANLLRVSRMFISLCRASLRCHCAAMQRREATVLSGVQP